MKAQTSLSRKSSRTLAALFILGILSAPVFSQKSLNPTISNFLNRSTSEIYKAVKSVSENVIFEAPLVMEDWMMETWTDNTDSASVLSAPEAEQAEESLEFEDWMFRTDWMKTNEKQEGPDKTLELESWMMNPFLAGVPVYRI